MTTSQPQGLYRPEFEHDGCGVGVVANIKGVRSHDIIRDGLQVLCNLNHRGAAGADPKTGDGAGILIQMPHEFFQKIAGEMGVDLPAPGRYAVGNVFLPRNPQDRTFCQDLLGQTIAAEGQRLLGWRDVPVDSSKIGRAAASVQPGIRQIFVGRGPQTLDEGAFERKLYVIRKVVERTIRESSLQQKEEFYIPSLFSNRIVYKGLLFATQIEGFYQDLADPTMKSAFALVHQRFSTNTLGSWKLAHPYRMLAHNGEINTLRGNINWMHARQAMFASPLFGEDMPKLFPITTPGASDSAILDNALELLTHTGRSLPHAMLMLIPEAWGDHIPMSQEKKDFYEYHSALMEPWDGPALVVFADGKHIGAILDRNGLRPFRYLVTRDDRLVMASETGVLDIPPEEVLFKARLQPGRMFYVDFEEGRIVEDEEIKSTLARRHPYGRWLAENRVDMRDLPPAAVRRSPEPSSLLERQRAFGYTLEDLKMVMEPMANTGAEPVGSMGNDIPLAVLSDRPRLLFDYFQQLFAQVTNPPLDAIREELVTSIETFVGSEQNLFEETPEHVHQLKLRHVVLTNEELEQIRHVNVGRGRATTLSTLFPLEDGPGSLKAALDGLRREASRAVDAGYSILILSDRGVDAHHAAIPSLLATSAVHHHLIREGTRMRVGLVVESGEPREIHHFTLLVGYGAAAINPYLALETIRESARRGTLGSGVSRDAAVDHYVKAIHKGVVKVMSKMGISTLQSYRGAQIFEAVGLGQTLVDEYFTWTPSRVGGIGLDILEEEARRRHARAFSRGREANGHLELDFGGMYYWRKDGEYHAWNPKTVARLQYASRSGSYQAYKEFAKLADQEEELGSTLRALLEFKTLPQPIPLEEVEPASEIVKRFHTGAISLGAISREAHETLAITMNRIGAKSNTGEGGEDYHRFTLDPNGDSRNSAAKQVASGRFGVTANYLVHAKDLQIKMAQGAKPGEGGQLPGHKIDEYIGWIRHTTPGVELISPPPHHDIYSIEDLAQLIHDLKTVNPRARINVKLVSEVGVGTIAAGVSKAKADVVLISGDSGGTGASPESSIKHAGLPWELGLAETQQVLVTNDLRGRIVVQTDGRLRTGRDIAIAALLGAEEFGIATASLVVLGCIMLRKCHLNTCSVGIATQDPELRRQFAGRPEHLINYFFFVAEHLREIMASLGLRTVDEMVGRVDKLEPRKLLSHWKARGMDLSPLLFMPQVPATVALHHCQEQDHGLEEALDHELIRLAQPVLEKTALPGMEQEPLEIEAEMPIRNSHRAVGGMLSGEVAKRHGEDGLPPDTITVRFKGSAGQSFGAWLAKGINFFLEGDANDYMGKGLSGGRIAISPPREAAFAPEKNVIVGNTVLYGATGGEAYIRGLAGERFCVRNSGVRAVIEGVGDHGCEYMTGGRVVVLGPTGRNFAAGMSGGIAYVLDEEGTFPLRCNQDMVELEPVAGEEDLATLRAMVEAHYAYTGSSSAHRVLNNWGALIGKFVRVMPRDYKRVLALQKQSALAVGVE